MERSHKTKLSANFKPYLRDQRVISLDISDRYPFMEAELIRLLKKKLTSYLPDGDKAVQ